MGGNALIAVYERMIFYKPYCKPRRLFRNGFEKVFGIESLKCGVQSRI